MTRLLLHPRFYFLAVFLACAALLAFGLYLEHAKGLEPCPMCIAQRIIFIAIGAVALLATLTGARSRAARVGYGSVTALMALAGAGVAARQSWIQRFPPPIQECGGDFYFVFDTTPLARLIPEIFSGTGDCTKRAWVLLGLSIAEWALVCFSVIALVTLWRTFTARQGARLRTA
jgi:disulfide bond formation protein DsbB